MCLPRRCRLVFVKLTNTRVRLEEKLELNNYSHKIDLRQDIFFINDCYWIAQSTVGGIVPRQMDHYDPRGQLRLLRIKCGIVIIVWRGRRPRCSVCFFKGSSYVGMTASVLTATMDLGIMTLTWEETNKSSCLSHVAFGNMWWNFRKLLYYLPPVPAFATHDDGQ